MRGIKMARGKTVREANRLTPQTTDRMQSHFDEAICRNSRKIDSIKRDLKADLYHMIKNEKMTLQEQHSYCPPNSQQVLEGQKKLELLKEASPCFF